LNYGNNDIVDFRFSIADCKRRLLNAPVSFRHCYNQNSSRLAKIFVARESR